MDPGCPAPDRVMSPSSEVGMMKRGVMDLPIGRLRGTVMVEGWPYRITGASFDDREHGALSAVTVHLQPWTAFRVMSNLAGVLAKITRVAFLKLSYIEQVRDRQEFDRLHNVRG